MRTPIAHVLEDAVASVAADTSRTTRRGLIKSAGAGAIALSALGRLTPAARAAAAPRIVVIGAGLAGLTCAYRLKQAGYAAQVYEASDRLGGRCWTIRGAFADGQIAEHGGELIDQGHNAIRNLVHEFGLTLDNLLRAEANGTDLRGYFNGAPYTIDDITDDLKQVWQKIHSDISAAGYPTTFDSSTQRGRELDRMSIVDWIEESVPGGMASRLGQLLDVAYNIEYGAESSVQSSLNLLYLLGFAGQGQLRLFGKSNEKYHVRGGNDQIPARLGPALAAQITTGAELIAIRKTPAGGYSLSFRIGSKTTTLTADKVVLALPFSILRRSVDVSAAGFSDRKLLAIRELGMGTNSKLHVQFRSRPWNALGCNGDTLADTGYQNTWEVTRAPVRRLGDPRRLHRRHDRRELRHGHTDTARTAVPDADRASAARADPAVERSRDGRLLASLRVDARLVLVLEGRAVHELRRHRGATGGQRALLRRAHVDRLPGLPERRGRDGRAGGGRGDRRPRVAQALRPSTSRCGSQPS